MAAILMLLPGIVYYFALIANASEVAFGPKGAIIPWILIFAGLIFGMIKSKKLRIVIPITVVILLVLKIVCPPLWLLIKYTFMMVGGVILILIYYFLIKD